MDAFFASRRRPGEISRVQRQRESRLGWRDHILRLFRHRRPAGRAALVDRPSGTINRRGIWLGLICGLFLALARTLVILGVAPAYDPPSLTISDLIAQIAFYFGLVGLVVELLFRGLVYRALEDWLGARWSIWGFSLANGLWHVFGQGVAIGAAAFFYGLIFPLMRTRTGGIIGLIIAHGWMDLATLLIISPQSLQGLILGRPEIAASKAGRQDRQATNPRAPEDCPSDVGFHWYVIAGSGAGVSLKNPPALGGASLPERPRWITSGRSIVSASGLAPDGRSQAR